MEIVVLKRWRVPCDEHGKPLNLAGRALRKVRNAIGAMVLALSAYNVPTLRDVRANYLLTASLQVQAPFFGQDRGQYLEWFMFKVVATGSYVTGGDTLNLSAIAPAGCGQVPIQIQVLSQPISGTSTHSGYLYFYLTGSNMANGKMQVMQAGTTTLTELAAGAYPAAILNDNIVGQGAFVYGS